MTKNDRCPEPSLAPLLLVNKLPVRLQSQMQVLYHIVIVLHASVHSRDFSFLFVIYRSSRLTPDYLPVYCLLIILVFLHFHIVSLDLYQLLLRFRGFIFMSHFSI